MAKSWNFSFGTVDTEHQLLFACFKNRNGLKLCIIFPQYLNWALKMEKRWQEKSKKAEKGKKYFYLNCNVENLCFSCQCGKAYKNFPALYLHFQRRHHQKISTKPSPGSYSVEQSQGKVIYTYFIETKSENSEKEKNYSTVAENPLQKIFNDFQGFRQVELSDSSSLLEEKRFMEQEFPILDDFHRFLEGKKEIDDVDHLIESIPQYFNPFIVSLREAGENGRKSEKEVCEILFKFWKWLKENEKTSLILEYNQNLTEEGNNR